MKRLFRLVAILVLSVALLGVVLVVKNNQDTRRGAAANDTSSSILPDTVNVDPGDPVSVNVWLNTGKDTDLMAGAEFTVRYDSSILKLVSVEPQSGYSLLNDPMTGGEMVDLNNSGYVDVKLVSMGTEKGGAVDVAKLNFTAVGSGTGSLLVQQGKVMITGQSTTWDVASNSPSNYAVGGSVTVTPTPPKVTGTVKCYWCGDKCINSSIKIPCLDVMPPADKTCVTLPDGSCTIRDAGTVTPTPTCVPRPACLDANPPCAMPELSTYCPPRKYAKEGEMCGGIAGIQCETGLSCKYSENSAVLLNNRPDASGICTKITGSCGKRCYSDTGCDKGMVCAPIWWPCQTLTDGIKIKLQNNQSLTTTEMATLIRDCPSIQRTMLSNSTGDIRDGVLPSFYGVCRNKTCPFNAECACNQVPTGYVFPIITVMPKPSYYPRPSLFITPGLTVAPKTGEAALGMKFATDKAVVGDEVLMNVIVDAGQGKVSAVNTRVQYMPVYFDILEVLPGNDGQFLKKEVNTTNGLVTLIVAWKKPTSDLLSKMTVATIRMKVKSAGIATWLFDNSYTSQISGVNESGNSVSYKVVKATNNGFLSISEEETCATCLSGIPKNKGNANCDGAVDLLDFEYWRSEAFDKGGVDNGGAKSKWNADFNCDSKVDLLDFEIWRFTVFP